MNRIHRLLDGVGLRAASGALFCATWVAFAYNVNRHWFLNDDAFITFRYARHLVAGHGPVFNPGEYVEGYTNFLWMLIMASGLCVGLDPVGFAPVLGVASGAATLWLLAWFRARDLGWLDLF